MDLHIEYMGAWQASRYMAQRDVCVVFNSDLSSSLKLNFLLPEGTPKVRKTYLLTIRHNTGTDFQYL